MADLLKFDLRLIERNLKYGVVSEREYQAFLRDLPDLEGNYEETDAQEFQSKGPELNPAEAELVPEKKKPAKSKE